VGKEPVIKTYPSDFYNPIPCIPFPFLRGRGSIFYKSGFAPLKLPVAKTSQYRGLDL